MPKGINPATSIIFGQSRISLIGAPNSLVVRGFQRYRDGKSGVSFDVAKCKEVMEVDKMLKASLNYNSAPWLHDPTIYLGFNNGVLAIAEGLVIDESGGLYRMMADLFVDLFGAPKVYRGKILIDRHIYKVVIYETPKVPTTDSELIVEF